MTAADGVVFLLDVDNTLLDNDRVQDDLRTHLASEFGKSSSSGLWRAVDGRVLIYTPKERMLVDVERRYPARHYVMVGDKLRILAAMKKTWKDRLTTIFPRQGHYALDPGNMAAYPPADIAIERIGDLVDANPATLLGNEAAGRA